MKRQSFIITGKKDYVVQDTYVDDEKQYYVWYSDEEYSDDNTGIEVTVSGADSATDGDMDIAYSLLIVDSVWGSDEGIDYK